MCNFSVWFAVGLVCVGLQCWGESENVAFDLHCTVRKTQYSLQLALDLYIFLFHGLSKRHRGQLRISETGTSEFNKYNHLLYFLGPG